MLEWPREEARRLQTLKVCGGPPRPHAKPRRTGVGLHAASGGVLRPRRRAGHDAGASVECHRACTVSRHSSAMTIHSATGPDRLFARPSFRAAIPAPEGTDRRYHRRPSYDSCRTVCRSSAVVHRQQWPWRRQWRRPSGGAERRGPSLVSLAWRRSALCAGPPGDQHVLGRTSRRVQLDRAAAALITQSTIVLRG